MSADEIDPASSRAPILDPAAIAELRGGGGEFFREIAELFCRETPAQIGRITRALEAGDLETVKRDAHSLKGASLSMGARRISSLCIELEQAAKQQAVADAGKLAVELSAEFERVRGALELELKR